MARSPLTARYALKHGVPNNAQTTSPYRHQHGAPKWVKVYEARVCGNGHVELRTDDGRWFPVDWNHPIFAVKE